MGRLEAKRFRGSARRADHNAELDALVEQLVAAGLLELFTDDGDEAMRLTPEGERVARQLAMSGDGGQDALLAALLGE